MSSFFPFSSCLPPVVEPSRRLADNKTHHATRRVAFPPFLSLSSTLLQSLLLLTLLTLPKQRPSQTPLSPSSSTTTTTTSQPPPPPTTRKSKKTDPERNSSTLDPEVLLDFLTDRLQIWRVLKDVNSLGLGGGGGGSGGDSQQQQQQEKGKEQKTTTTTTTSVERDEVQVWWEDVVEPLFVFLFFSPFSLSLQSLPSSFFLPLSRT